MVRWAMGLTLVVVLSLTLNTPASAGWTQGGAVHGGFHGGFHAGGFRGGFHHHHGFRRFGCCSGPLIACSVFVSALAAPPVSAYPYPAYAAPAYAPAPVYEAPVSGPPVVCYVGGCYHLQGNGVSVPYQWVWVP